MKITYTSPNRKHAQKYNKALKEFDFPDADNVEVVGG